MKRVPSSLRALLSDCCKPCTTSLRGGQLPAGDATWTFLTELMAVKVPFAQATDMLAQV